MKRLPLISIEVRPRTFRLAVHASRSIVLSRLPQFSTMETESQRPKRREGTVSALNAAIEASGLAEKFSSTPPVKAVFGSVRTLPAVIKVCLLLSATLCSKLTPS